VLRQIRKAQPASLQNQKRNKPHQSYKTTLRSSRVGTAMTLFSYHWPELLILRYEVGARLQAGILRTQARHLPSGPSAVPSCSGVWSTLNRQCIAAGNILQEVTGCRGAPTRTCLGYTLATMRCPQPNLKTRRKNMRISRPSRMKTLGWKRIGEFQGAACTPQVWKRKPWFRGARTGGQAGRQEPETSIAPSD
jgi:hypothetical protein